MSNEFAVDPDGLAQIEKELDTAGQQLNDTRNTVPDRPADAGTSTAILDTVVSHLLVGAGALLDDLADTISGIASCRTAYLRTDDDSARDLLRILQFTPQPFRPTDATTGE